MSPAKKVLFLVFILFVFRVSNFVFPAYATDRQAYPKPYITCDQQSNEDNLTDEDDEWHSLRPYQASPCKLPSQENFNEQALLCGSDLIVRDDFHPDGYLDIIKHSNCARWWTESCVFGNNVGPKECTFDLPRSFIIETDAYNSTLPIAGQTELVAGDDPKLAEALKLARLLQEHRLQDFEDKQPPELTDFVDYRDYYATYQEWRGKNCWQTPTHITVPIVGINITLPAIMLCGELNGGFLDANFWSELYPNIPYSSTEDRIGKYTVEDMIWVPGKSDPDITPRNLVTGWLPKDTDPRNEGTERNEGMLMFPHMEENLENTSLLQSTYLPKDLINEKQTTGSDIVTDPPDDLCTILNVRKNPGDQLFGERTEWSEGAGDGRPAAKVSYIAHFTCMVNFPGSPACVKYPPIPEKDGPDNCIEWTYFYSDVSTNTPLIEAIWNQTVAGSQSVVRRFFPRSGEEPLKEIQDLPTETDIVYEAVNKSQTGIGRGQVSLLTQNPKLYFPHLGGIHKYFLNGIQSLIRPKDFPARPASLSETTLIPETTQANEYLSWFLQGTVNRAEQDPLDIEEDVNRIVTLTGPLNKLLSQHSQWRNTLDVSRVAQTEDAKSDRHNQIAGCTIGIKIPFTDIEIGGFPVMCPTQSQKDLPAGGTIPGSCDICSVAKEYNVPCCFLKGIWDVETGQSPTGPTGQYGNYQCCNSVGACGPMQIMGGLVPPLSAGEKLDPCVLCDSWILASRLLIMKKCVAAGECNSWEWKDEYKDKYPISESELEVVGYYYGLVNGCYPDNASQCRWGDGKSYCDAIDYYCKNDQAIPDQCTQQYCSLLTPPVTCP